MRDCDIEKWVLFGGSDSSDPRNFLFLRNNLSDSFVFQDVYNQAILDPLVVPMVLEFRRFWANKFFCLTIAITITTSTYLLLLLLLLLFY